MKRMFIAVLAIAVLAAGASVATAKREGKHHGSQGAKERLFTLQPDPAGNPEGIAFDKRSKAFYVSITAGGAIYRGSLKSDTVEPFIEGEGASVGIKVKRGKLYVAGVRPGRSRSMTSPRRRSSPSSRRVRAASSTTSRSPGTATST